MVQSQKKYSPSNYEAPAGSMYPLPACRSETQKAKPGSTTCHIEQMLEQRLLQGTHLGPNFNGLVSSALTKNPPKSCLKGGIRRQQQSVWKQDSPTAWHQRETMKPSTAQILNGTIRVSWHKAPTSDFGEFEFQMPVASTVRELKGWIRRKTGIAEGQQRLFFSMQQEVQQEVEDDASIPWGCESEKGEERHTLCVQLRANLIDPFLLLARAKCFRHFISFEEWRERDKRETRRQRTRHESFNIERKRHQEARKLASRIAFHQWKAKKRETLIGSYVGVRDPLRRPCFAPNDPYRRQIVEKLITPTQWLRVISYAPTHELEVQPLEESGKAPVDHEDGSEASPGAGEIEDETKGRFSCSVNGRDRHWIIVETNQGWQTEIRIDEISKTCKSPCDETADAMYAGIKTPHQIIESRNKWRSRNWRELTKGDVVGMSEQPPKAAPETILRDMAWSWLVKRMKGRRVSVNQLFGVAGNERMSQGEMAKALETMDVPISYHDLNVIWKDLGAGQKDFKVTQQVFAIAIKHWAARSHSVGRRFASELDGRGFVLKATSAAEISARRPQQQNQSSPPRYSAPGYAVSLSSSKLCSMTQTTSEARVCRDSPGSVCSKLSVSHSNFQEAEIALWRAKKLSEQRLQAAIRNSHTKEPSSVNQGANSKLTKNPRLAYSTTHYSNRLAWV